MNKRNPFFPGVPASPESFTGRTKEIGAAFDQIYNRSHLAIWGGPGMGKSSFLEQLISLEVWEKHQLDSSQAVIVFLNCQSIIPFTPSGFWQEVLSNLKDKLESEPSLQIEVENFLNKGQTTKESLRQVLRKLGKKHKFVVLLVDNFDAALISNAHYTEADMQEFLSECRNLAVHSQERKHLSMIVSSLKRLSELGPKLNTKASPWYNHYLFQSLKPLTDTEIDKLISKAFDVQLQAELKSLIPSITGKHPALLQIIGSIIYRNLRTGDLPNLEAIVREFESTSKQIFENIWNRCNEDEQTLLMLLAIFNLEGHLHKKIKFDLSDIKLIFIQQERDLTNLEEQGVVKTNEIDGKKIYSFTSPNMEKWVVQEVWNTNDDAVKKRQKVFLNLMSKEQVEKVTNAMNWFWMHKDKVPSTLKLISTLMGNFHT
ncbi:MAG: ATP-binding protein [Nostoc sp. ChiSLP02]|nr:ATP-binding protein [Nostoc sp. DedSLP05]MDZ8097855.1 ATP-binding protein [Nostoc sp. DedSLP01]MDZ8183940.1 ATP-binding protein [Nostoc sp. ChiSLP02]